MLQKKGLDQDPLGSEILKILYASEEEQVTVNEKGELTITQAGEATPEIADDQWEFSFHYIHITNTCNFLYSILRFPYFIHIWIKF